MGEHEEVLVNRLRRSVFSDPGPGESFEEFEEWVTSQPLPKPVTPESIDFDSANAGLPLPRTVKEEAERYRLAQACYLLRKWREARPKVGDQG